MLVDNKIFLFWLYMTKKAIDLAKCLYDSELEILKLPKN